MITALFFFIVIMSYYLKLKITVTLKSIPYVVIDTAEVNHFFLRHKMGSRPCVFFLAKHRNFTYIEYLIVLTISC